MPLRLVEYLHAYSASTREEGKLNTKEGWDLFTRCDGVLEVQRLDTNKRFVTDTDALMYVTRKALKGSLRHLRSLMLNGRRKDDKVTLPEFWGRTKKA